MTDVQPPPSIEETPRADDLADRIVSRICHDLVSPLGAIANGVELLHLSGAPITPETELISESVATANARIRLFRIAFGASGRQAVPRAEVVETLLGLQKGSRLTYEWTAPGNPPRDEAKAVFLLILCLEAAMPTGGRIRIGRDGSTWTLSAEATRFRVVPELWDVLRLDRDHASLSASQVQFALLPRSLYALGRELRLDFGPDKIHARL